MHQSLRAIRIALVQPLCYFLCFDKQGFVLWQQRYSECRETRLAGSQQLARPANRQVGLGNDKAVIGFLHHF